jgi:hypothetical protein
MAPAMPKKTALQVVESTSSQRARVICPRLTVFAFVNVLFETGQMDVYESVNIAETNRQLDSSKQ